MLARLQKITTVGLLLLSLLWAYVAWRAGHVAWALGGSALLLLGYALVLAAEFVLARAAHGEDPTPPAAPSQLLRAWCGEVAEAPRVFCWRQPFRSHRWSDCLPADAMGRRGVLLVHGFVCNRGIWNAWLERLHARNVPCVAVNLEPLFGSIDEYESRIDDALERLELATRMPPVVVAHSMGGLALRRWWSKQGNGDRIHHAITIATPHAGTWLARFAMTPNGRQMRRNSPWLAALAAQEPTGHVNRLTCFYGNCDNIVFPPSTATMAGADNRHLPGVAHVDMVTREEPWLETLRWLR